MEEKLHLMGGEQKLIEKGEFMRGWFFTVAVISKKRKTAAFGETQYVVRVVEHRIEFPLFYINCDRNVPIDIIRSIILFLYCYVCCGVMIVNVKEEKK